MSRAEIREQEALASLLAALDQLGLDDALVEQAADPSADVVVRIDDRPVPFDLKTMSNATPDRIRPLLRRRASGTTPLLVADRIPRASRDELNDAGWSWLDRRGHLRLRGSGVLIDGDFEAPQRETSRPGNPIVGLTGRTVAYALLTQPDTALPVRGSSNRLRISPASISIALSRLRDAGLLDADGLPLRPELFWALSDVWRPVRTWIRDVPHPDDFSASAAKADLDEPGWCLTGTAAAIQWGAPIAAANPVIDLYIVGPVELSLASRRYSTTPDPLQATASLAVPPVSLVSSERKTITRSPWVLAHPVAVALDLAQDRGRGREILGEWTPPSEYERVW